MELQLQNIKIENPDETLLYETNLTFHSNSFNILLGETGAGKTTLIRLIAGLEKPTQGKVVYKGNDVTDVHVRNRNVAMVYQQFINYPSMTVFDNIASPLKVKGIPPAEIAEKVHQVVKILRIEEHLKKRPSQLSGGQQQRLAIARALIKDAEIVLLDEPLVNLDYKLREDLRDEIRELFQEKNSIVVYATTEPAEPLLLTGNVIVMDKGRVLQQGSTNSVFYQPQHLRVAQVYSYPSMNVSECHLDDQVLHLGENIRFRVNGRFKSIPSGSYILGVRAHHLRPATGNAKTTIPLSVDLAEITGSETLVHLHDHDIRWVMQLEGVQNFEMEQALSIEVDEEALFLFDKQGNLVSAPEATA